MKKKVCKSSFYKFFHYFLKWKTEFVIYCRIINNLSFCFVVENRENFMKEKEELLKLIAVLEKEATQLRRTSWKNGKRT